MRDVSGGGGGGGGRCVRANEFATAHGSALKLRRRRGGRRDAIDRGGGAAAGATDASAISRPLAQPRTAYSNRTARNAQSINTVPRRRFHRARRIAKRQSRVSLAKTWQRCPFSPTAARVALLFCFVFVVPFASFLFGCYQVRGLRSFSVANRYTFDAIAAITTNRQ